MGWQDQTSGQTYDWSHEYAGQGVDYLFDDLSEPYWTINNPLSEEWVEVQFATPQKLEKLRAQARAGVQAGTQSPTGIRFKASSSGSFGGEEVSYVDVSGLSWTTAEWKEWQFSNATAYTYWRMYMDKGSDDNWLFLIESEWMISTPVEFSADILGEISTSSIDMAGGTFDDTLIDVAGLDDTITAAGGSQSVDLTDIAGLDDTIIGQIPIADSTTDIAGLDDTIIAGGTFQADITDIAGLGDFINGGLETQHALTDQAGLDDSIACLNWSEFLRENQLNYIVRYFCTLTGAADDTTDLEFESRAFQARKRDGESTYLSVSIAGFDLAEQIADRANGQMIINMAYFVGGVEQLREEILRVDLENIRTDEGPTNRSITLTGHRTESFGNQIATLTDPNYKYISDGIRRYRFAIPDPWINPGDTIRTNDDEFRVGYITYIVSDRYRQMEITEA